MGRVQVETFYPRGGGGNTGLPIFQDPETRRPLRIYVDSCIPDHYSLIHKVKQYGGEIASIPSDPDVKILIGTAKQLKSIFTAFCHPAWMSGTDKKAVIQRIERGESGWDHWRSKVILRPGWIETCVASGSFLGAENMWANLREGGPPYDDTLFNLWTPVFDDVLECHECEATFPSRWSLEFHLAEISCRSKEREGRPLYRFLKSIPAPPLVDLTKLPDTLPRWRTDFGIYEERKPCLGMLEPESDYEEDTIEVSVEVGLANSNVANFATTNGTAALHPRAALLDTYGPISQRMPSSSTTPANTTTTSSAVCVSADEIHMSPAGSTGAAPATIDVHQPDAESEFDGDLQHEVSFLDERMVDEVILELLGEGSLSRTPSPSPSRLADNGGEGRSPIAGLAEVNDTGEGTTGEPLLSATGTAQVSSAVIQDQETMRPAEEAVREDSERLPSLAAVSSSSSVMSFLKGLKIFLDLDTPSMLRKHLVDTIISVGGEMSSMRDCSHLVIFHWSPTWRVSVFTHTQRAKNNWAVSIHWLNESLRLRRRVDERRWAVPDGSPADVGMPTPPPSGGPVGAEPSTEPPIERSKTPLPEAPLATPRVVTSRHKSAAVLNIASELVTPVPSADSTPLLFAEELHLNEPLVSTVSRPSTSEVSTSTAVSQPPPAPSTRGRKRGADDDGPGPMSAKRPRKNRLVNTPFTQREAWAAALYMFLHRRRDPDWQHFAVVNNHRTIGDWAKFSKTSPVYWYGVAMKGVWWPAQPEAFWPPRKNLWRPVYVGPGAFEDDGNAVPATALPPGVRVSENGVAVQETVSEPATVNAMNGSNGTPMTARGKPLTSGEEERMILYINLRFPHNTNTIPDWDNFSALNPSRTAEAWSSYITRDLRRAAKKYRKEESQISHRNVSLCPPQTAPRWLSEAEWMKETAKKWMEYWSTAPAQYQAAAGPTPPSGPKSTTAARPVRKSSARAAPSVTKTSF